MSLIERRVGYLPRLIIANGTIEAVKWLALLFMIGDHINKYLLNDTVDWLYDAGRVAMPLFTFVLAYNLARPNTLASGGYRRTMIRLAVCGAAASPVFIALGGVSHGWWPLNILFTLLVLTATLRLITLGTFQGYLIAGAVFILGGSLVEFWWPALVFGIAVWSYARCPGILALLLGCISCVALGYINGNQWALGSIPILAISPLFALTCPRLRWFFYAIYPAHLTLIWLARIPMRQAGYLFFT